VGIDRLVHGPRQVQRRRGTGRPGMNAQRQGMHALTLQLLGTPGVGGRRVRHVVVGPWRYNGTRLRIRPPKSYQMGTPAACPAKSQSAISTPLIAHPAALVEARPRHRRAHVAGQPLHVARVAAD